MDSTDKFLEVDTWQTLMFLYNAALKEVNTKIEILNDEFLHIHNYNPIEHVKSRIKSPESIVKKLRRHGHEVTMILRGFGLSVLLQVIFIKLHR